ncbi:hypothetical protein [Sphingomonas mesophila]|uniref:hypothetical protein n=1 Tax=Sphingomonas mesophila TaxID=2303576 RepID=UPI0013C3785D|nr:hypothetical protein [Sphingomonas mesophila]
MPRPDPLPAPSSAQRARLLRAIRWVALFALAVAALAVAIVTNGEREWHVHMMIATGLGVFLTILLAGALMLLAFFSNASGHDSDVAQSTRENDEK